MDFASQVVGLWKYKAWSALNGLRYYPSRDGAMQYNVLARSYRKADFLSRQPQTHAMPGWHSMHSPCGGRGCRYCNYSGFSGQTTRAHGFECATCGLAQMAESGGLMLIHAPTTGPWDANYTPPPEDPHMTPWRRWKPGTLLERIDFRVPARTRRDLPCMVVDDCGSGYTYSILERRDYHSADDVGVCNPNPFGTGEWGPVADWTYIKPSLDALRERFWSQR